MGPEFEDERIVRWRATPEDAERTADPTVLDVHSETEELFEGRTYALGASSLEFLTQTAAEYAVPLDAMLEYVDLTAFKILAKRNKNDGLITYMLVYSSHGDRNLLLRQDGVSDEQYRKSVEDFEAAMLRSQLVQPPVVITRQQWQQYEEGMRG
jgi:hypothetical protein